MPAKPKTSINRMLLRFLRGAKRHFLFGSLLAVAAAFADMLRPKIIQYTVDCVLMNNLDSLPASLSSAQDILDLIAWAAGHLWFAALAVILCSLAAVLLRCGYEVSTVRAGETFIRNMRDNLFAHILSLDAAWHSAHQTGDIIQRCTSDVEEVKNFLSDQLITLLNMVLTICMALVFLFQIDAVLALVVSAAIPLIVGFSLWFHGRISENYLICDESEGVLSTIAQENLTGVRVVRAFGREREEQRRFAEQNTGVTRSWVNFGKYISFYFAFGDFLTGLVTLLLLCAGSWRCVHGLSTVGSVLAAVSYMAILVRPVRGMGRVISEMSKASVSIRRLYDIMQAPPEQDAPGADCPPMNGDIVFDNVSFAYPGGAEVLHSVSFTVPAGTVLGILGGTGSGKSTLTQLLSGQYPLPEDCGSITVGGRDLRTMQADWIRRNVGCTLQEPFLFSRSIKDNLSLGKENLTDDEIFDAARAACLHDTVEAFPRGYDTFVGERGVTLSGGQKQRAAIARTLTSKAPILIFDDSLSAVDTETDAAIRAGLKSRMRGATVILISHRIATLMEADNVLVLENGAVSAYGTPAQLREQPGLFRTVCEIQSGKEGLL